MQVGLVIAIATERVAGKLRQAVLQRAVEQVKLQLECNHRANAQRLQTLQHPGEDLARLELYGRIGAVGADQHLPQWLLFPADRLERAGDQPAQCIRVAIVEAVIANREQATLGTEQHAVLRQLQRAAGGELFEHVDGVAFTVEMPGDVQADQVDIAHFGVLAAKRADFVQQGSGGHCEL